MDSQQVQLFHEHVLVKEAATSVPTPWHQDAPYYCVDSNKTVSMWIPLDDKGYHVRIYRWLAQVG